MRLFAEASRAEHQRKVLVVGAGRLHTLGGAHTAGAVRSTRVLIPPLHQLSDSALVVRGARHKRRLGAVPVPHRAATAGHLLRRVDILREAQPPVAQGVVEVEDLSSVRRLRCLAAAV